MPNPRPYHKGSLDEMGDDDEVLKSPLIPFLLSMSSYVRKINGDEFHCIDSDEEGSISSFKARMRRFIHWFSYFMLIATVTQRAIAN